MASQLMDGITAKLPGLVAYYDKTIPNTVESSSPRFSRNDRLADLIIAYAGSTSSLGEISSLVADGRLQPLDLLPQYGELLQPEDIHKNLLAPVTLDGHLWAVPIRVVVPLIAVRKTSGIAIASWKDFFALCKDHPVAVSTEGDYYALWLTLMGQQGIHLYENGHYSLDHPECKDAFEEIRKIYSGSTVAAYEASDLVLCSSDTLADFPEVAEAMRMFQLPGRDGDPIYCSIRTWYIAVNAELGGSARRKATETIAALLSDEIQGLICTQTYSLPPRPSQSNLCAKTGLSSLQGSVSRLKFRTPGWPSQQAEMTIEERFLNALRAPESFQASMVAAEKEANELIAAAYRPAAEQ